MESANLVPPVIASETKWSVAILFYFLTYLFYEKFIFCV